MGDLFFEEQKKVQEHFFNAQYLEAYAEALVTEGHGTFERDKTDTRTYIFENKKHRGGRYRDIRIVIKKPDLCLIGFARGHELTIEGSKYEVREFMDCAKIKLDSLVSSVGEVRRQMREKGAQRESEELLSQETEIKMYREPLEKIIAKRPELKNLRLIRKLTQTDWQSLSNAHNRLVIIAKELQATHIFNSEYAEIDPNSSHQYRYIATGSAYGPIRPKPLKHPKTP